jgi:hypothetical protein
MTASDTSSLDEALQSLETDLTGSRGSIAAQSGIPFAILRYAPSEEFLFRRKIRLFVNNLHQQHHRSARFVSISRLVWNAIRETDGVEYLFKTERMHGIMAAQTDLKGRLEPQDPCALAAQVMKTVEAFTPKPDLVILVRAGGLAPHIYRSSALLHELQQAGFSTPTVLCYPGSAIAGTDLRFFDLPAEEGLGTYNYRVKIYGTR